MNRRSRLAGQFAMLALVGLLVVAFPGGFALAQDLPDPGATTQSNHTLVPIINLTSTPTETPTPTTTQTATSTPTSTVTPTPDGDNNTSEGDDNIGQTHVVGTPGEPDCNSPDHATIQKAVDHAQPGDTILVCPGTYKNVHIETANLTLRADGEAEIKSVGEPAIQINATGVTIQGFTVGAPQAEYTIAVGGQETTIKDNAIEPAGVNSTMIFVSDGLVPETGEPDTDLGAATGSRIVNNKFTPNDQTLYGVWADADGTVIGENTILGKDNETSIRSSGNRTIIRNNILDDQRACIKPVEPGCTGREKPPNIIIGAKFKIINEDQPIIHYDNSEPRLSEQKPHNWAHKNLVINNTVHNSVGMGLAIIVTGNISEREATVTGTVVRNNIFDNTWGVRGWTTGGLFINNKIYQNNSFTGEPEANGPNQQRGHTGLALRAVNTRVTGNYIQGHSHYGFWSNARNLSVINNTFSRTYGGMVVGRQRVEASGHSNVSNGPISDSILIINNTFNDVYYGAIKFAAKSGTIRHNQVTSRDGFGIDIHRRSNVTGFHHNQVTGNGGRGVVVGNNVTVTGFRHNNITGNGGDAVYVAKGATITQFHHNLIDNNDGLGINKENFDKTDGQWPILNATHNIWGCGGPSGGLEDPHTNRTANGTGDGLSASDKPGVSNIHFDPFFVRADLNCPSGGSNPTPTPKPTPTPTPSPTPTPTPLSPVSGNGNDTGGSGGSGTGGSGGSGTGGSGGSGTSGSGSGTGNTGNAGSPSEDTAGKPPTDTPPPATATPSPMSTPSPTISPTPKVEPGFGVLVWLIGTVVLIALLVRRRLPPGAGHTDD